MTTKNVQTRAKTEIFLLGTPLDALSRTVLPTELDILRRWSGFILSFNQVFAAEDCC